MTANEVIKIAQDQVDYLGKALKTDNLYIKAAPNGKGPYTKYSVDLYQCPEGQYYNGSKFGADWCAMFVDWLFYTAAGQSKAIATSVKPLDKNGTGAGVKFAVAAYKAQGLYDTTPRAGDSIFYRCTDGTGLAHTGFVESVDADGTIHTIEGNWKQSVARRTVRMGKAYSGQTIDGFGHPKYDDTPSGKQITQFQFRNNEGVWGDWQNSDSYQAPSYTEIGTYKIGLRVRYYHTGSQQVLKTFPDNTDPTAYYTIEQKIN